VTEGWILALTITMSGVHIPMGPVQSVTHETYQQVWETEEFCQRVGKARSVELTGVLRRAANVTPVIEWTCHETGEES